MTENLEIYEAFGALHTERERRAAAEAGLCFLFGTDWEVEKCVSFLAPATDRLFAFAGEEATNLVSHHMNIMRLPDIPDERLVEQGIGALRNAFEFDSAPHKRKYWNEVIRNARLAAKEEK